MHNNFSLAWNYPKVDGDSFRAYVEECHPGYVLMNVPNTRGGMQDIVCESSGHIHYNRPMCIDCLDIILRSHKKINVFEDNLWMWLSSSSIVEFFRVLIITHYFGIAPVRWFSGESHTLGQHEWSISSMGRLIDLIKEKIFKLAESTNLIIDKSFMLGILSCFDE